jgi:hypothetical protein
MTPSDQPPDHALHGEVVFLSACDFAYDTRRTPVASLLGQPLAAPLITSRKRGPSGRTLFRPLTAELPAETWETPEGPVRVSMSLRVLPVGALSIRIRIPFVTDSLGSLVSFHSLTLTDGSTPFSRASAILERARAELHPHAIRPLPALPEGEAYTVFCLHAASPGISTDTTSWLASHQREVAALLNAEPHPELLSAQEVDAATSRSLSYYRHDLVVTDWDSTLLIDHPADFPESLHVIELANVQLEELDAYDSLLDAALDKACRDLSSRQRRPPGILTELRELRIDLARFSDELSNATKFFGEWHLARVYENTARVFHLADWHRAIDEKLRTLDSLYEFLKQDRNHRLMLWLESAIILLFIIDLLLLFTHKPG